MKNIALDSMIFIYFFEKSNYFGPIARDVINKIEKGEISAVTSFITIVETLSAEKLQANPVLYDDIISFFQTTKRLKIIFPNWDVSLATARLRQKYKSLRTPDAIQLATATLENVDYLLTNDDRLLRLSNPPIPVIPLKSRKL